MRNTRKSTELYNQLVEHINSEGSVPCEQAPDMFFIDHEDHNGPEKMKISKALCANCPVQLICLEYALEASEQEGIWGGLTRNERKALKRSRVIRERVY